MLVQSEKDFPQTPFREIELRTDQVILVDPDLYDELSQFHWFLKRSACRSYVCRCVTIDGKKHFIRMHRLIAETPDDMVCHHINGNPLDNRRANLQNLYWYDHTKMHSWR
jgi:hypothetical protein